MITLCKNCEFFKVLTFPLPPVPHCLCPAAPTLDFVTGHKFCHNINTDGNCLFYQPQVLKIQEEVTDEKMEKIKKKWYEQFVGTRIRV